MYIAAKAETALHVLLSKTVLQEANSSFIMFFDLLACNH